jgi:hypothetical protein
VKKLTARQQEALERRLYAVAQHLMSTATVTYFAGIHQWEKGDGEQADFYGADSSSGTFLLDKDRAISVVLDRDALLLALKAFARGRVPASLSAISAS